jgi:hypothetical protein
LDAVRFGFNALYDGHRIAEGRINALSPDVFRIGILASDPNYWVIEDLVARLALRPLVCIYGTGANPDPTWWSWVASTVVERHPNAIIQVGNEPNSPEYGEVPPARMAEVVTQVARSVPSGTGVYGPAMNPLSGWEDYMRAAYAGVPEFVRPALHLYPRREINKTVDHACAVARDIGGVPQVTECGCPRDAWPQQADATTKLYQRMEERGVGTTIFHTAAELPSMGDWDRQARLWFLRNDGSRTGLFDAIDRLR